MNTRSTPGLGQWLVMTFIVASVVFLLYRIYQYGTFRQYMPAGLTIAGVEVGGLSREEAGELVRSRYQADVVLYHGEDSIAISPADDAEFELDLEEMLRDADYQREQQDFWAGFWGFLWNRPIEVEMVQLQASHDAERLRRTLETIASSFDRPAQAPQPAPGTLSFHYGEPGVETDINASLDEVASALYRPTGREAHLTLASVQAERPDINLLARLLVNHLQDERYDGVASIFILDLDSGQEVRVEAQAPMSGIDLMKLPVVLDAYRFIEGAPTVAQTRMISQTLLASEGDDPLSLLNVIAGQDNPYQGAQIMTESMWRLGLKNTYIANPFGAAQVPGGRQSYETPANSAPDGLTTPDPEMQTTAEDMGSLLAMLYYCAEDGGGFLQAAYPQSITQAECQQILEVMRQNKIGSLIEEGVPPDVRHGWVGDTHADAGIIYSPGGDYVLVEFFYHEDWLPWEESSPLMADISRATYNYFNFDNPYLEGSRVN